MSDDTPASAGGFSTVKATPRSGSAAGVQTTWVIAPVPDGNLDPRYFDPAAPAKVLQKAVVGTEEGWKNVVHLPPLGGQRYRLTVTTAGSGGEVVKDLTLVAKRTVPVTVYYVSSAALAAWDAAFPLVQKAYDEVGVTLAVKAKVKTDVGPRPLSKGPDVEFRREMAKFFTGETLPPVQPPVGHLRIFMLEKFEQYVDTFYDEPIDRAKALAYRSGTKVQVSSERLASAPVRVARLYFPARGMNLEQIVDVKAFVTRASDTHLGVRLSQALIDEHLPAGGRTGRLQVELEVVRTSFLGWSNGSDQIAVATRAASGGALRKDVVARIVIHELGHAFQQVRKTRPTPGPGATDRTESNDYHYEKGGGEGEHCNIRCEELNGRDPDPIYVWESGRLCVMYHDGGMSPKADPRFCEECALNMKVTDIGAVRMEWPS